MPDDDFLPKDIHDVQKIIDRGEAMLQDADALHKKADDMKIKGQEMVKAGKVLRDVLKGTSPALANGHGRGRKGLTQEAVLRALTVAEGQKAGAAMSVRQIAEQVGMREDPVAACVQQLLKKHKVVRTQRGRYAIAKAS